jgi:pyrroloquinoline-quinone synthase
MASEHDLDLTAEQAAFVQRLRSVGTLRYHDKHPFHLAMHAGVLTQAQVQGWVANRYYYQINIPVKDAAILSNLPDREKRRVWITRILDHDGTFEGGSGGIDLWLALGRAVGLDEAELISQRNVQVMTRFAVDAYVSFARTQPWLIAVASSLTELFAPELMSKRITVLTEKYPWIDESGLTYFRKRLTLAPKDAAYALRWVVDGATNTQSQDACVNALGFKCDVLWAMLDAITQAYGAGADGAVRA